MISKNWLRRSVLGCGIVSILAGLPLGAQEVPTLPVPAAAPATGKSPALALLDAADASQWQAWAKEAGWAVIAPAAPSQGVDNKVLALAKAVEAAIQAGTADPAHIY